MRAQRPQPGNRFVSFVRACVRAARDQLRLPRAICRMNVSFFFFFFSFARRAFFKKRLKTHGFEQKCTVLNIRKHFLWKKKMIFSLVLVTCIFAQGFSLKMQLTDQTTMILTSFIRFFASTTLKTFILDRCLSENAIKLMLLHYFEFGGGNNTVKQMFFQHFGAKTQ